ncbi:hypothetical protein A7982_13427 [Minicystis rosea]|nr:hypothetical protein A7982_13427 [Minicystis rosea]
MSMEEARFTQHEAGAGLWSRVPEALGEPAPWRSRLQC